MQSHHFVLGALSSRMTRDLLDKVNNPGGSSASLLSRFSSSELDDEDEVFFTSVSLNAQRVVGELEYFADGRHRWKPNVESSFTHFCKVFGNGSEGVGISFSHQVGNPHALKFSAWSFSIFEGSRGV